VGWLEVIYGLQEEGQNLSKTAESHRELLLAVLFIALLKSSRTVVAFSTS